MINIIDRSKKIFHSSDRVLLKKMGIILSIVTGIAITLMGCGSHTALTSTADNGRCITIEAQNAPSGDSSIVGMLSVDEFGAILIEPNLKNKSEIQLQFYSAVGFEMDSSIEELEVDSNENDYMLAYTASGTSPFRFGFQEGKYYVKAVITENATGTINIMSLSFDDNNADTSSTAKEAFSE